MCLKQRRERNSVSTPVSSRTSRSTAVGRSSPGVGEVHGVVTGRWGCPSMQAPSGCTRNQSQLAEVHMHSKDSARGDTHLPTHPPTPTYPPTHPSTHTHLPTYPPIHPHPPTHPSTHTHLPTHPPTPTYPPIHPHPPTHPPMHVP